VDIDPLSVKATQENSDANEVLNHMEIGEGSVEEVLNNKFSIRSAPLVLANILAPVIIKLFSQGLRNLTCIDGILVLSGILEEQESNVLQAAEKYGLKLLQRKQMGDWVSLALH
jgi:ribosomal protein L11 methyltransferase